MKRALLALVLAAVACGRAAAQETGPIVAEGVVEAPVDSVWAAWATGEGLRSWLAPHADIELRVGGLMRTHYAPRGTLGDSAGIENRVLSFEPGRMLSIQVHRAPQTFPFPTAVREMWTVVYFHPEAAGRTRVRIVGMGFGPDDESQRMRTFFERGNVVTLRQLQRRFAGESAREGASE